MSAFKALDAARAAGVTVRVEGKDLVLSGDSEPPPDVLDMLRRHKRSIMGLLQPTSALIIASTDITGSRSTDITEPRSDNITGPTPSNIDSSVSGNTSSTDSSASGNITSSTAATMAATAAASTTTFASADILGSSCPISASAGINGCSGTITLRRPQEDEWPTEDWQAYFNERAAIAEFDAGLPKPEAEKRAFDCCVAEWIYRHPVTSPPGPCPVCGDLDRPNDDLLPVGLVSGQVWLHRGCSAPWRATRIAEAVAALRAMNISAASNASHPSAPELTEGKATTLSGPRAEPMTGGED